VWWGKGGADRAVRSHAPADSLDGRGDRAHVRLRRGSGARGRRQCRDCGPIVGGTLQ